MKGNLLRIIPSSVPLDALPILMGTIIQESAWQSAPSSTPPSQTATPTSASPSAPPTTMLITTPVHVSQPLTAAIPPSEILSPKSAWPLLTALMVSSWMSLKVCAWSAAQLGVIL